jgi:hypothetical protein
MGIGEQVRYSVLLELFVKFSQMITPVIGYARAE